MLTSWRRRSIEVCAILCCALVGDPLMAASAQDGKPVVVTGGSGESASVDITAKDPGSVTDNSTSTDRSGGSSNRPVSVERICKFNDQEIDCETKSYGAWRPELLCWIRKVNPQPAASDPIWDGHDGGAIYWCQSAAIRGSFYADGKTIWLPDPSAEETSALADPVKLAEEAIERMQIRAPVISLTPLDPAQPLLVGVNSWLWLDRRGSATVGPITRTVTAGNTTVEATAKVSEVDWTFGDGRRLTCPNAGTAWTPARGTGPSPTCGHRYSKSSAAEPDGMFQLKATAHWRVDWAGGGQTGRVWFTLTGQRDLKVTELQVLQSG